MDTPAGREQFALRVEVRRRAETQEDFEPPGCGWCAGSEQFRQELLAEVQALASPKHRGEEIRESALAKAERTLREEVEALGWSELDLGARRKGDPRKVRIAARLRRETTHDPGMDRDPIAHGRRHLCRPSSITNERIPMRQTVQKLCSDPDTIVDSGNPRIENCDGICTDLVGCQSHPADE